MLGCRTLNSSAILVFSCHSLQKWHSSSRHQPPTKKTAPQKKPQKNSTLKEALNLPYSNPLNPFKGGPNPSPFERTSKVYQPLNPFKGALNPNPFARTPTVWAQASLDGHVHRIGRCGRGTGRGRAYAFLASQDAGSGLRALRTQGCIPGAPNSPK